MRQEEKYRRLTPQQIADVFDCCVVMSATRACYCYPKDIDADELEGKIKDIITVIPGNLVAEEQKLIRPSWGVVYRPIKDTHMEEFLEKSECGYKMVAAKNQEGLTRLVNIGMREGWTPLNGVITDEDGNLRQSMVKKKTTGSDGSCMLDIRCSEEQALPEECGSNQYFIYCSPGNKAYMVMCSNCGHVDRKGMFENILDAVSWIFSSWVRGHVDGWN